MRPAQSRSRGLVAVLAVSVTLCLCSAQSLLFETKEKFDSTRLLSSAPEQTWTACVAYVG